MKLEHLGPYRIEQRLGKGGMGAVYLATYTGPGDAQGLRVAIKALNPQLAQAEGFRERFEAEIESLKKLKHEGIVRLFGYGEQEGILFYSMELVEGTSLEEQIRSGQRFSWQETLQIGIQICRALKHAHDHGVVHRDIKPANLLLTKDRQIKIADFGIARLFGSTQLTTAGGVLGTADYMSPEQADGRPVTEKCDQYSLGGVLYALLAGRPPFRAKTLPEMLQLQRFAEPEPVRRYAPETPEQLEQLLQQLLSKDPEARFPNALVLGRHLEAMHKALSRPAEVAAKSAEIRPASSDPVSTGDATGSEAVPLDSISLPGVNLFDAPTLAQPSDAAESPPGSPGGPEGTPSAPRFTTVDEEVRRLRQQEESAGHLALLGQSLALLLLLAGLGWGAWRLTRPATADQLYDQITSTIEIAGDDDLRTVAQPLKEFSARFGQDPRAEEVRGWLEQLEIQRLQRQARMRTHSLGETDLGSVELWYLAALRAAETDPERAHDMLTDILTLYDPEGLTQTDQTTSPPEVPGIAARDQSWLRLARQEHAKLTNELAASSARQLPQLRERLSAAAALARRKPAVALAMYRAVERLYADQPWAAAGVAEAREAIDRLVPEDNPN